MKCVWKNLLGMVLLAGALCVGQTALAESSVLELQATVAAEHTITVACSSGGRITLEDGTEPGDVLQVGHNRALVFCIVADKGYKVKSVLWDGDDVTSWYRDGKLTIPALLKDGVLQVIYEKETNAPATGDASRPIMVWLLPIVAFMVIQLCRRKRCSSRFIQVDLS